MIRAAAQNALLQESKTQNMVSIFAEFHALPDNGGDTKTASASLPAKSHGRLLLRTTCKSARSHAIMECGGRAKMEAAAPSVIIHGVRALLTMVFQPVLDLANLENHTDLMIRPAAQFAKVPELRIQATVSQYADLHAWMDFGGRKKIINATASVMPYGSLRLLT